MHIDREQRESLKHLIDQARRERLESNRRVDRNVMRDGDLLLRGEPKVMDDAKIKRQCPWCPKDDFNNEHGRLVHAARMHGGIQRAERKRLLAETRLPGDWEQIGVPTPKKPKEEPVSTEIVTAEGYNAIDHLSHFSIGSIEVIDFIEDKELGFHEGSAVEYISWAKHRGTEAEDLKKAAWYLLRRAQQIEESSNGG